MRNFLFIVCLPWAFLCPGQSMLRHAVKLDVSGWTNHRIGLALEVGLKKQRSFELSAEFEQHQQPRAELFNGDQIANYAIRYVDTIDPYTKILINDRDAIFIGDGRPLAFLADHEPLNTFGLRAGFRFNFQKKRSPWRFFCQPGFSVRRLKYYSIRDRAEAKEVDTDSWVVKGERYDLLGVQRTYLIRQTRSMRLMDTWFGSLNYDIGISRKIWRTIYLEGRLNGGLNAQMPYKPKPPRTARITYLQPMLHLSCFF
jgi:hypothetical protein